MTIYPAPHDRAKTYTVGALTLAIVLLGVAADLCGWFA